MKTIILLTNNVQPQQPIANLLREHNSSLRFCSALSARDLTAIAPTVLREARLVSFANDIAVPEKVLLQLGYSAYRFYSAPVQYPGLEPAPEENEEDTCCFSAIAQSMTIWPDSRKVVGLETFTIPEGTAAAERERLVFARLAQLFWRMSSLIACKAAALPSVDGSESQRPALAVMN